MWKSLSVTCIRSVGFSGYCGFLHITEILLRVALNSITPTLTLTTIHRFTASDCFVMQLVHITTTVVMSISIYWEGEFVFNFPIVNFPFICSNIPAASAYGVYISMLTRYSKACGSYQDFLDRCCCWTKVSSWLSWSHYFESFMVAIMTWLTAMKYLCH